LSELFVMTGSVLIKSSDAECEERDSVCMMGT